MAASVRDGWAEAVESALTQLVDVAGLDVAFGARVEPDGQRLVIRQLHGARTTALRNLVVLNGTGLGGKAMALRRPVTVTDYLADDAISHQYDLPVAREGLRSMLAVPLVTSGRVSGIVYAALRQRLEIGERAAVLAMSIVHRTEQRLTAAERARREPPPDDARVRDAYRDLGSVLGRIEDPALRADLERIRHRLVPDGDVAAQPPRAALSKREHEVLRCAALGQSNAEIAGLMGLSPGTVKAYLRSVMHKLGSRNRMEAVNTARELGYGL